MINDLPEGQTQSEQAPDDAFNRWWDADELTQTNPYQEETPIWWAWEAWQAAVKAGREEAMDILRSRNERLRHTLQLIVDADWRKWDEEVRSSEDFVLWAKSRANHALTPIA